MDLVFSFAKRMTVLVNGTLLTEGDPDTIANDPRVKAVYLGHGDELNDAMGAAAGDRFTAGPPQGETAPSGGSAAHKVAGVGAISHG
jgi:branched-chain amino acid transport system ATP-binding protein